MRHPNHALAPLALAAALMAGLTGAAHAQAESRPIAVQVAAQPLELAVRDLAQQAGLQLLFPPALVAGKSAPAVSGTLTPRQALERLLAGSGLVARTAGEATVIEAVPADGGVTTLGAVTVTAQSDGTGTTEGNGSYSSRSTSTATKLPLSLRETPQSATVITRQRMDDQGITTVMDAVRITPGLFVGSADGPGRPSFAARGFGAAVMYEGFSSDFSSSIPSTQSNMALFDRGEIVRGATGLAQGRGNPSAAINMVHKRPTAELQGTLTASAASWDDYTATADVGGPLNAAGTLRGRTVVSRQDAKTFRDYERHDHNLFYGVIEADLAQDTLLTVGLHRQDDFSNNWWARLPISANGQTLAWPRRTFPESPWAYADSTTDTLFATLEHGLGSDWRLRAASLLSKRTLGLLGTSASALKDGTYSRYVWGEDHDYRAGNFDLSAAGTVAAWGRRHEATVGATYQRLKDTTYGKSWTPSEIIGGPDIPARDPYQVAQPVGAITSIGQTVVQQRSVYASTRLHLTDPLKLLLGLRGDWYEYQNRTGRGSYKVNRNLTHYVGLTYDLDRQHTLYTSYTDIFTPQSAKDIRGEILKPIVGKNYEIGAKGEYFGGDLNASIALFKTDQTNRARTLDDQSACPTYPLTACSEAAGLVRSKGVELEVLGAITPNWQLAAGYTYSHAKYQRGVNTSLIGTTFTTNIPKQQFKLSSSYKLQGELRRWRVGGSVYQQSEIYQGGTSGGVAWRNRQGGYATADLMLGWMARANLDLQLNVSNVFDKTYFTGVGYGMDGAALYGEPRKFKLTARYMF